MAPSDLINNLELTALDGHVDDVTFMLATPETEEDSAPAELVRDNSGEDVVMGDIIASLSMYGKETTSSEAGSEAQIVLISGPDVTLASIQKHKPSSSTHNYSTPSESSDKSSSDSKEPAVKPTLKKLKVERPFGPTGISISARSSRAAREAFKNETFEVDQKKEARWRKKIRILDPRARFLPNNVKYVGHFACGNIIEVKDPFDTNRFRRHIKDCKGDKKKANAAGNTPTLAEMIDGKWGQASKRTQKVKQEQKQERLPCCGLSEADNVDIPTYLYRSTAPGGGSRSVTAISQDLYGERYRDLENVEKDIVDDIQVREHEWTNDHANLRVHSTVCSRWVEVNSHESDRLCDKCKTLLGNNKLKIILRKPTPHSDNFRYNNKKYRNSVLGDHYACVKGLKSLIDSAVSLSISAFPSASSN